ncbi:MAG: pentapeptide repeat-containing protein [Sneathiella sp.]
MKKEKMTVADWLNINQQPDLAKHRWTGTVISTVLLLLGLFFFGAVLVHIFMAFFGIGPYAGDVAGAGIRNVGLLMAAIVGLPFLVWRSVVNQKQVNIAEQGHITETINKAVEGLGSEKTVKEVIETPKYRKNPDHDPTDKDSDRWLRDSNSSPVPALRPDGAEIIDREIIEQTVPNLEVRIGAIYALERIAKDSLRDHMQIMEILCAYVRENARCPSLDLLPLIFQETVPRTDIQATIAVIGRRSPEQVTLEWENEFRLDFRGTNLSGVDFSNGDFSAALLHNCYIENANFNRSKLHGTQFDGSLLRGASFLSAELTGSKFHDARVESKIGYGKLRGVSLLGADLSALDSLGVSSNRNMTIGDQNTKLNSLLDFNRHEVYEQMEAILEMKKNGISEIVNAAERELFRNTQFADWSPFGPFDEATFTLRENFLNRLGLTEWPYQGN